MAGLGDKMSIQWCGSDGSGIHIASYAGISVNPPRSPDRRLPLEDAKLIKSEYLLQATAHCYARFSSADDENGIVGICPFFGPMYRMNGI